MKTAYPTDAAGALVPPGRLTVYHAGHPAAQSVRTGRPVLITHLDSGEVGRVAADAEAARLLARAGVHTDMAVPLIARGQCIGVMGLARARNPAPFDADDLELACELASRAALSIDNAVLHQHTRSTAEALQRSLLPRLSPHHPGLEIAARYRPAQAIGEVGGDWYDVIPLDGDRTALAVGDVMGSGIAAAATMGRLRTATSTLADLDLDPARVLTHLDRITLGLDPYIATCVYAVHDPRRARLEAASAGHLPPVLIPSDGPPRLLDLPTGTPLGVGGVPFESSTLELRPGDQLVLYTDGLVETRDDPIDARLDELLRLLSAPSPPRRTPATACCANCATRPATTTSPSSSPGCCRWAHSRPGRRARKSPRAVATAPGASRGSRWPTAGTVVRAACGMYGRRCARRTSGGSTTSRAPASTVTGTAMSRTAPVMSRAMPCDGHSRRASPPAARLSRTAVASTVSGSGVAVRTWARACRTDSGES